MEHPDDPLPPYPSIWRTEEVKALVKDSASQIVRLDQCAFGAPTKKPTMIMVNSPKVDALQLRCGDVPAHTHEVLEGREVDGQFRTRRGMVYPQKLCAALAATLLAGIRQREKPMGNRITVPPADPRWTEPSRWHPSPMCVRSSAMASLSSSTSYSPPRAISNRFPARPGRPPFMRSASPRDAPTVDSTKLD